MRRADQITGVTLFLGSLLLMWESRKLPPSGTFGPGPEFFPFWLGALMAALAVLLVLHARRSSPTAGKPRIFPGARALVTIGATLDILVLDHLGFLLATGLLTAFLLKVVERVRWSTSLAVAVGNAVALQTIFRTLLGVSLPKGFLGF
jgi:hypothetical protein